MLSLVVAVAGPAAAQSAMSPQALPEFIHDMLQTNLAAEQFVAQVAGQMRQHDRAGDGLDPADVDWLDRTTIASNRSGALNQAMRYDLDGDLRVTPDEVRETVAAPARITGRSQARRDQLGEQAYQRAMEELAWFDGDGDGVVTANEVAAAPARAPAYRVDAPRALMTLPPAADGRLTATELNAFTRDLFTAVDRDGDQILSEAEATAARDAYASIRRPPEQPMACRLPPARPGDLIVLVGVSGSGGGRPRDSLAARATTLRIAPGKRPLYIVATSGSPVRWVLEGDVARVARIVAMAETGTPREGLVSIVGAKAPVAQVRSARVCIPAFADSSARNGVEAIALVQRALGRRPDAIFSAEAPTEIVLPPAP